MKQKYLGIMPYDEADSFEFAGRGEETWALYDRIVRNDYTVYYAASGEGKSSLIRAGLLPILRRRDFFPVYIVFKDEEFATVASIESVIESRIKDEQEKGIAISYEQSEWSKSRFTKDQSDVLKNNLWWKLRNYCFKHNEVELKPLFIFDQFEEVFTKANYEWTDAFFTWLEEISTDYVPDTLHEQISLWKTEIPTQKNFKALFSFRTEYLGDLDYWCVQKHFLPSLQENRMCLKPLTIKGAKEVVSLNKSLEAFADRIIQGCSDVKSYIGNENQPCVYALILSVVCLTLSDSSEKEREILLNDLSVNQDDTIDKILLTFYKKKLKSAGLDYLKDEKIIENIENALVDEKGKRSRRDMDEESMRPIAKWIERLSQKDNGLIKIIGRKEIGNAVINTVEFPHDRLCKAINSSRKERQEKIEWKLNRQGEWMQFGIIAAIVGIIAFLWTTLMSEIKPVIHAVLSFKGINWETIKKVAEKLWDYINGNAINYHDTSLNEGFSAFLLMILLAILLPFMTTAVARNDKKWQILSVILSILGIGCFGILSYRNINAEFSNNYVSILSIICFFLSLAFFAISSFKLKSLKTPNLSIQQKYKPSLWPLWGGYFIFASYAFYEFLFRTTFGINEPCDSSWALIVLPLLYMLWGWGFFNMKVEKKGELFVYFIGTISILLILFGISYTPFYNTLKQSYGFGSSISLIILWLLASIVMLWKTKSKSKYYVLSNSKRILTVILGTIVIITTFFLNLGFNPYYINPKSVCHVASWRDVVVYECDSLGEKKFGVVFSNSDDTIIPCCISKQNISLGQGRPPFSNSLATIESNIPDSLFEKDFVNGDGSLKWNLIKKQLITEIPTVPTLEQYLHQIISKKHPKDSTLTDSINYYAAKLFKELRNANINYALSGKSYNLDAIESLCKLDTLQQRALSMELKKFSLDAKDNTLGKKRSHIMAIEDKHLVDFYRELSRSFFLCLMKDRAYQSDMSGMFTLARTYLFVFFQDVPCMNTTMSFNIYTAIDGSNQSEYYLVGTDDVLNRRLFAWYYLFNSLCQMDISYNVETFVKRIGLVQKNMDELFKTVNKWYNAEGLDKYDKLISSIGADSKELARKVQALLIMNKIKSMPPKELKEYSNSIVESLEKFSEIDIFANTSARVDESFDGLRKNVLNKIIPLLKIYMSGVYNNAFENICRNLILVSAVRGNDISENTDSLSKYFEEKNKFYNRVDVAGKQIQQKKLEMMDIFKKYVEYLEPYTTKKD